MVRFLALALSLFVVASPLYGADQNEKYEALKKFIHEDLERTKAVGVAIAVIENGHLTHSDGFGVKKIDTTDPIGADTLFDVQSVTKTFTASAVMMLAEKHRLNLSSPITKYVPYFSLSPSSKWKASDILVRELLLHTSGYPGTPKGFDPLKLTFDDSTPAGLSNCFKAINTENLLVKPGAIYNYSNFGFALLGLAVESVAGIDYSTWIESKILPDAGMRGATFDKGIAHSRDHIFTHSLNGDQKLSEDVTAGPNAFYANPYGGLFASAKDLGHFGEILLQGGGNLLESRTLHEMMSPIQSKGAPGLFYGYGFHVRRGAFTGDFDKDDLVVSAIGNGNGPGGGIGTSTSLYLVPSKGFGIVVMTNDGTYRPNAIADRALEIYLGKPQMPPSAMKTDPSTWGSYEGTYSDPTLFGEMRVRLKERKLYIEIPSQSYETEITQLTGNAFVFVPPPALKFPPDIPFGAIFWMNSSGKAEYLSTLVGVGTRDL